MLAVCFEKSGRPDKAKSAKAEAATLRERLGTEGKPALQAPAKPQQVSKAVTLATPTVYPAPPFGLGDFLDFERVCGKLTGCAKVVPKMAPPTDPENC